MSEALDVEAFLLAQQDAVLRRAAASLANASPGTVADETHRLVGTLATYRLHAAVERLSPLVGALHRAPFDPDEVERAREAAAAALAELAGDRVADEGASGS